MIIPYIKRKNFDEKFLLRRVVPNGLRVEVRKDDKVKVDTILATGAANEVRTIIDVSSKLKVDEEKVKRYIKCLNGERVSKGDLLAHKKKGVMSKERKVLAPSNGVVNLSNIDSGIIKFMGVAKEMTLNSGVNGKVVSIIRNSDVNILCHALRIKAFKIFGNSVQGEMYIVKVAEEDEEKINIEIGSNLKGSIVLLDSCHSMKFFRKLATVGVSGVIQGGIRREIINELNKEGLWGMTLCVLGSYGEKSIDNNLLDHLMRNDGALTIINNDKKELVLTNFDKDQEHSYSRLVKRVEVGDRFFILDSRYYGMFSEAVEVNDSYCKVSLENGKMIKVDYANLAVIY